jgi:lysozyme
MTRAALFDAMRPYAPGKRIPANDVAAIDALADRWGIPRAGAALTPRVCQELLEHEALVQEAYKDSEGVWTWGVGITSASGIAVTRYIDKPQPILACLEAYVDRLRSVYLPSVLEAFDGYDLTETQLAAALSFHYNTGAIKRTDWVRMVRDGNDLAARGFLTSHYLNGGALQSRRDAEANLFFDGRWSQTGKVPVYPVRKPSYTPDWGKAKRVDVSAELREALS